MTNENSAPKSVALRRPGGQPGNQNARRHGYYSPRLDEFHVLALAAAPDPMADPINQQIGSIAMLAGQFRVERARAATLIKRDPLNLKAITHAVRRVQKIEQSINLLRRLATDAAFRDHFTTTYARLGIDAALPPYLGPDLGGPSNPAETKERPFEKPESGDE